MELYHVLNRGVDKRTVFLDEGDYLRFVHDLYALNNKRVVANPLTKDRHTNNRDKLVEIHAWCCMPNHYHLLVSPLEDDLGNLSLFAKKINMGYAKFFNEKYTRTGALWQGKYKKIHIVRDAHFLYIPYYIHLNPLDLALPEWREGGVKKIGTALTHLKKYRWNSFLDYYGGGVFPSVIERTYLEGVLGSRQKQEKTIAGIISDPYRGQSSLAFEI